MRQMQDKVQQLDLKVVTIEQKVKNISEELKEDAEMMSESQGDTLKKVKLVLKDIEDKFRRCALTQEDLDKK